MLDKKITDLLNKQINREFYSSYFYLDISNYYIDRSLNGFGNWFDVQAKEEHAHAMLFIKYLQNNGEKVILDSIDGPAIEFKDYKHPLTATKDHELLVSRWINDIYAAAFEIKDFRTMQFLDWFVKEQAEEEKNTDDLINRFDLFGTDPRGLYLLDQEMSARTFTAPSLVL